MKLSNKPVLHFIATLFFACILLTTELSLATAQPQPLNRILVDIQNRGWNEVLNWGHDQELLQGSVKLEEKIFEGSFTATSDTTKFAIFSDDGCNIFIDGQNVHGKKGAGQALPKLGQSLHRIDFEFNEGQTYQIRVEYSNISYTGQGDIDGVTLFAYRGPGLSEIADNWRWEVDGWKGYGEMEERADLVFEVQIDYWPSGTLSAVEANSNYEKYSPAPYRFTLYVPYEAVADSLSGKQGEFKFQPTQFNSTARLRGNPVSNPNESYWRFFAGEFVKEFEKGTAQDALQGLVQGVGLGVYDAGEGVYKMVVNPAAYFTGIKTLAGNPRLINKALNDAANAYIKSAIRNPKEFGQGTGKIYTNIALAVVGTKGTEKVAVVIKSSAISKGAAAGRLQTALTRLPKAKRAAVLQKVTYARKTFCFVAGTLVLMAGSSLKPIQQISAGDLVLSRDEKTGQNAAKQVLATSATQTTSTLILTFSNGEVVECTNDHPFYVEGQGFISADQIRIGSSIISYNSSPSKLLNVQNLQERKQVYNLTVADFQTYFVGKNGLWVHNNLCSLLNSFRTVRFKGSIQNRLLRELTSNELRSSLVQAGLKPSDHFIKRLREVRTANLGMRDLNDLRQVFRYGTLADVGNGKFSLSYGKFSIIFAGKTGNLVSLVPS